MFEHKQVEMPKDCIFKISPSSIGKFFSYPSVWYKEQVLGEKVFEGNTATVLGTICHHIYEKVSKGEEVNREMINYLLDNAVLPEEVINLISKKYIQKLLQV